MHSILLRPALSWWTKLGDSVFQHHRQNMRSTYEQIRASTPLLSSFIV